MKRKIAPRILISLILLIVSLVLAISGTVFSWLRLIVPYAIIFFSISGACLIAFAILMLTNRKSDNSSKEENKDVKLEEKRYEPDKKE